MEAKEIFKEWQNATGLPAVSYTHLNLYDRSWRIYSKNPIDPAQVITENAEVNNSMIVDGCYVDGTINHSILSTPFWTWP